MQSDTGEVSDVITGQQLSQLATNGRSMYSLISLTPGASSGQGDFQIPTPVGGDANVSFNGMRMSHNLYLLDGSESSDRGGAGGSDVMPSLDAIAEFRQMTSNYSAEYGLSSSATMTAVIKSGTKQYHASAWEFLRNDALDARNYFNPSPQKVAELRFHTFGFNVGGPVDFWAKEHKTFFFYNMEWRRLIQGQTLNQTVPDTAWYGGDVAAASIRFRSQRRQRHRCVSLRRAVMDPARADCTGWNRSGQSVPQQHDPDLHDRSELSRSVAEGRHLSCQQRSE